MSLTTLLLIGCVQVQTSTDTPSPINDTSIITSETLAQVDEQGSVTVEITHGNLSDPGDTSKFDVAIDTHSVELDMDINGLATLTTAA
jgi:hypothetical protein